VGYRKPHPMIFRTALNKMGLAAAETLFVGDNLAADVGGAGKIGMVTVLKDPTESRRSWRYRPDHRIRRLAELAQIIASYNR